MQRRRSTGRKFDLVDAVRPSRTERLERIMWIVRLALKEPHTIVVLIILIFLLGTLAIVRTPTDIFPNIDIPVVSVIWNFNGLPPQEMADRIISVTERNMTTVVDNISHVE